MKEMQQAINSAFEKMHADGTIQKIIEAQLVDTVKKTMADSLREYSDFGKTMKQAIVDSVQCNVNDFGLAGLRDTVLKVVKTQIGQVFEAEVTNKLVADLQDILKPAPAEIKLSELVDRFKESLSTNGESGHIAFHCGETSYNSMWISIDADDKKTDRQCDIRFLVQKEGGPIYGLNLARTGAIDNRLIYGHFCGFDRLLFQMLTAKTKVIPDVEDVETSYGDF